MHLVRNALVNNQLESIYPYLSRKSRSLLQEAHMLLQEQNLAVRTDYPPEHRFGARGAYPEGVLSAASPEALMAALLRSGSGKLKRGPGLVFGLTCRGSAVILDTSATVATQSGETVHLNLEDGTWKLSIWESAIEQNLERIQANHATLKRNLETVRKTSGKTSR